MVNEPKQLSTHTDVNDRLLDQRTFAQISSWGHCLIRAGWGTRHDPLAGGAIEAIGCEVVLAGEVVVRPLLPATQCGAHLGQRLLVDGILSQVVRAMRVFFDIV